MKLSSFRDIDRVHVRDLIEVGLVGEQVRGALPEPLRSRLDELAAGEP